AAMANRTQFRGEPSSLGVPALRVAATCVGSTKPRIDVVAGKYAWNEEKPGISATPAMDTFDDCGTHLWTLIPEGDVGAEVEAGDKATLTQENGQPVVTFPMPAPLQNATMKMWMSPKIFRIDTNPAGEKREYSHLVERSQLTVDGHVIDTQYSEYGDWNDKELLTMILLPRHIVRRRDGHIVTDLDISL